MTNKYAILNSENIVINTIIIDDSEYDVNDFISLTPESDSAIKVENNGEPFIGEPYVNGYFRTSSPYVGWVWDENSHEWNAPISKPEGRDYVWNNSTESWELSEDEKMKDILAQAE
jgi:hypothetical protein